MDESAIEITSNAEEMAKMTNKEQTQLLFARLMEGGQEDSQTCKTLDDLTRLLNDDNTAAAKNDKHESITSIIDDICVDTLCGYLDMRQSESVRGHATLTVSAFFKIMGEKAAPAMKLFFFERIQRGTYDDFIVAFCVAASIFPIVPDMMSDVFLTDGFLPSLAPLMRRKWKSRKVETACLEMLNAASMNSHCREAIYEYCAEWLEEVVNQDPEEVEPTEGSIAMRRHSEAVKTLASVVLTKIRAVPTQKQKDSSGGRVTAVITSVEDLSEKFVSLLLNDPEHSTGHSIEGLAYASIQPAVKEEIANNEPLLKKLVTVLANSPPKSTLTYGALSIFQNLTRYQPKQSEEEKKMSQLKAYANASGKLPDINPLNDDKHVEERCKKVFRAGLTPVLVTHSKNGSASSLSIIVSILFALSFTSSLRGQLAQQGAVNLLVGAFMAFPDSERQAKRTAAQGLARILISIDPSLVFGGTRARPQNMAIRPLLYILPPDPAADTRDLLPTFESLMALTNLASTDDHTRTTIVSTSWTAIEEQLLSSNHLVSKAAVELICNLVQSVEAVALYADGSPQAFNRLHILLALADAEDDGTRSAAGGALASLTAYEEVVTALLKRERGVEVILGMCKEDSEDIRHRGCFVLHNVVTMEGKTGSSAREHVKKAGGVDALKECVKKSRRAEVVEVAVEVLKLLVEPE